MAFERRTENAGAAFCVSAFDIEVRVLLGLRGGNIVGSSIGRETLFNPGAETPDEK
jgi:hypothetical protein